jgi:hypothetical protein
LGDPGCAFCARNQRIAQDLANNGQHYDPPPVEVSRIEPFDGAPTGTQYYQAVLQQVGATILDRHGTRLHSDERVGGPINLVLHWSHGHWILQAGEHA